MCMFLVSPLPPPQHTLETALVSASQELGEQGSSAMANPSATASLLQQRDVLQNGLLGTCRELSRVHTVRDTHARTHARTHAHTHTHTSNAFIAVVRVGPIILFT